MRLKPKTVFEGICCLFIVGVLCLFFYPVFVGSRPSSPVTGAMSNLKQVAVGHLVYLSDWNEHYPPASSWSDCLSAYTKRPEVFRVRESKPDEFAVAFMRRLGGTRAIESETERQALVYETTDTKWNANHNFTQVWWHKDRATAVAFADSHAKAFRYYDSDLPSEGTGLSPHGVQSP